MKIHPLVCQETTNCSCTFSLVDGLSKVNEGVEGLDDNVSVSHALTHVRAISEILDEEVDGGDTIAQPGGGSGHTLIEVLQGLGEVHRESGCEDLLEHGDHGKDELGDLNDHLNEAFHGALHSCGGGFDGEISSL